MKPQILKIIGINSFNEPQEIDFSKILEKGIFGIFGDTGSGKSTIIDSITLALYGKIVRYDGKIGNGDFLNLSRNNGKVEFIFSIKDGKEEIFYEIVRQFKRTNKGDIKSDIIRLSIFNDEQKNIIADKKKDVENKIIDIIGLSYEDFTKAVVLPQGKFSDFLMLENADKRKMLQRIFGLEKYGDKLKDKINEKKYNQENVVYNLKKEIEMYGNVSIINIQEQKSIVKEKENLLSSITIEIEKIEEEEKYFNSILKLKQDYIFYDNKLQELIPYEKTVLDFENRLTFILEAEKIVSHIIEEDNILNENKKILTDTNILKQKLEYVKDEYNKIENNHSYYKSKKDEEKPKLDKIKQDLEQCLSFINERDALKRDVLNINNSLQDIVKEKEKHKNKVLYIENQKSILKREIQSIIEFNETNKIDNNVKENLKRAIDLKDEEKNINNKIEDIKQNLTTYDEKIIENKINVDKIKKEIFNIQNIIKYIIINNVNNLQNEIKENDNIIEQVLNKNIDIQNKIEELNIQIKIQENKEVLNDLAKGLMEDKPCPLCGSTKHPSPIYIILDNIIDSLNNEKIKNEQKVKENVDYVNNLKLKNNIKYKNIEDIKIIGEKHSIYNYESISNDFIFDEKDILKNIYDYENKLNNLNQNLNSILISNENIINLKQEKIKELDVNNNMLLNIKNNLDKYYNTLQTNSFYEKYENILNLENIVNKNNERYLAINKEIDTIENENIKFLNNINDLEKQEISLETKRKEKQLNINDISIKIEKLSYNENPKEYIKVVEKDISDILINEQKYKDLFEKILEEKINLEKDINDNLLKIKINKDNINKKSIYIDEFINKSIFKDKNQVLENYKQKHQKDFYQQKIKSYKEKFDDYSYNIKRIEEDFEKLKLEKNIDIGILNEKVQNIANKKKELSNKNSELIERITTLKIDILQKEETFKKVENIAKIIKEEERKLDLLKELSDLNKGGIFVEYVANRYIKHIVLDASKRLFNMSQSKYSLELLESNFVIKDNYNGGIIRSPRSLSGGEVFMASLSLALSLSSKIQLKNKSPLEIFFLDEGFGTLDNNTLDTVINTLEQLQTNNISVGIITHVEEIKNRVQNKIIVTSSENGAKINV